MQTNTWDAVVPDFKVGDVSNKAHLLKNYILEGAGVPDHWFIEGAEINRRTAAEMGQPTLKRLGNRQKHFKNMLAMIFRQVI